MHEHPKSPDPVPQPPDVDELPREALIAELAGSLSDREYPPGYLTDLRRDWHD